MNRLLAGAAVLPLLLISTAPVRAQGPEASSTFLCDIAYQDCRTPVLSLIRNETVGIDVSFWFMTDARYSNELVKRWQAGVPVRVIMDPRANSSKPANATQLQQLRDAGIPMLNKPFGDIAHWKGMIFAGQQIAEFSGANYSPYEYKYEIPYVRYQDETIYFSSEPDVVQSLMRRFDDVWIDTDYSFYANAIPRVRTYPTSFVIAPEFNLPPDDSYTNRLLPLLDAESEGIDVVMFRITDGRPADALIRAVRRGVPVRLYAEPLEYRNPKRLDDPYHVDRMYVAGVHIKMRAHEGQNHQKTVRLVGQRTTIFGTSNWSTASDDNQLEVNYFTTKGWFYDFFAHQFDWKWNNQPLDGSSVAQTTDFVPLAPDTPSNRLPANAATAVGSSVTLSWYAGPWARSYDLYLGVGGNPPRYRTNVSLGPSQTASDLKSITVTGLLPGTAYSWRVVARTAASVTATGAMWTFTTEGTPPSPAPVAGPDTTAPLVFLVAPANGATLSGVRQVSASISDNGGLAGVQFKLDGVNLGAQDRSAPFTISWDTTTAASGDHILTAEAIDLAGNRSTSEPVSVTVSNGPPPPPDTTAPTVAITAPSDNATVSGATSVAAESTDDVRVAGVQFLLDGVNFGPEDTTAPYAISWNTATSPNGPHTLTARARDAAGNTAESAPVNITVTNEPPPPPPPSNTVVLHAAHVPAGNIFGNWVRTADATAADGVALWNTDNGASKIAPALVTPQHYVEISFEAVAGTPYHLWIRMRAQNDHYANDSIHVQFSDAVNASGSPIYQIGSSGSTNSAQVALEESDGNGVSGWGWADQGWNGLGPHIYFATSGTHTLRIQQREDGALFDQVVLSPDTYLTIAPGTQKRDTTIIPIPPPDSSDTTPPVVSLTAPANDSVVTGTVTISADSSDDTGVAGVRFMLDGAALGTEDTAAPYALEWATASAANGAHTLTAVARDGAGNVTTSAAVSVTVSNTPPPPDTTAPAVLVTAPLDGATVSGTITVTADATDDVNVVGVQFQLDGVNLGAEDQAGPYSVQWDTTAAGNAGHALTAIARDAAGNVTTSAIVNVTVSNTAPPPPTEVVLRAADVPAEAITGNWVRSADATAADQIALWNIDNGASKIAPALVTPQHYVEITFNAQAGVPYHLWIRMRAQNDYFGNDSIHVQFSDSVNAAGAAIYRIGSSGSANSAQVVLEESDGAGVSGWGWADQGWNGLGPNIYFATSGTHTIRIQQREDGALFDQIVLSPSTYLTAPPGPQKRDTTIVPKSE